MSERIIYTGLFLTDSDSLLRQIPPQIDSEGSSIFAHHVTKEFRPSNGVGSIDLGRKRTLLATGQVVIDGIHAVTVNSEDGESFSKIPNPHLTIATERGVPPIKSGAAIAKAKGLGIIIPIDPPIAFEVVEGYFDGKVHTSN